MSRGGDGRVRLCQRRQAPRGRTLAIGTTNAGTQVRDDGYQQGRAFANFIRAIASAVAANGVSSQVVVRAAIDVEMDWNTYPDTREWYDGYDSLTNAPIYNFGDAAGCSQTTTNTTCNNGWTQNRVWWVSDGFLLAQSLPQIYTNSGSQARQWHQIARHAYLNKPATMVMSGTLTRYGACQQVGGRTGTANTPAEGWTQLYTCSTPTRRSGTGRAGRPASATRPEKVSMVKSAKHDRRVWWPAFLLAAIGVLALLVVPQARSVDTPATPRRPPRRPRRPRPPRRPASSTTSGVRCRPRKTGC